jgi:TonB-linked SusC/RagA family outer membrane protein
MVSVHPLFSIVFYKIKQSKIMKKRTFYKTLMSLTRLFVAQLLLAICFLSIGYAQKGATKPAANITGQVNDEKNDPVVGAAVQVKGTSIGTLTDENGQFKLSVTDPNAILVVSFVGYERQEMPVGKQTVFDFAIAPIGNLEEVVVVGYGTQKKGNMTGAVSVVDVQALENRPVSNAATALQGVSPGLMITRTNGQPGAEGIGIQIRGATTANGNVEPLVVVDGVAMPGNTLTTMNPNDIETISVLKDAGAASIYGAQAAGGVILITTKKAKNGKARFNYTAQHGIDWSINVPERLTLLEEAEFSNLARKNSGSGPEYNDLALQRIRDGIPYVINPTDTTTWEFYNQEPLTDQILKKYSASAQHNLSVSGGSDKLSYVLSGGFYGKDGVFKIGPDDYQRYNARLNLSSQLSKIFSVDTRLAFTRDNLEQASGNLNGQGMLYEIYRLRTRTPFFTPLGQYNGAGSAATAYARLEAGGYNRYERSFIDGTFTLSAKNIVKGLTLRAITGTNFRLGNRANFARTVPLWGNGRILGYINQVNSYTLTDETTKNYNQQFLADYLFTIKKNHNFSIMGGYQWENFRFSNVVTGATNLVSNDLPTLNLGDDKTKTNSQSIATNALQSVIGRVRYDFDGKYLLEGSFRYDESSRLAPDSRVKFFPSVSAGWNVHREKFFPKTDVVSEMKLRASWGRLGGALGNIIGNYDYLSQLSRGSALVLGDARASYLFQAGIPSPNLSWETIETSNFGADLSFFKNRLQISADYYEKYNRNMLTAQNLSAVIGVGTPRKNDGELKSWGWELEARYRGKIGDFTYSVGANLSDNQNKLIRFGARNIVGATTNSQIEGYPLNSIFGFTTDGYFSTVDEVKAWAFQDNRTGPGDVKYKDLNGDGRITVGDGNTSNYGDLSFLGTTQPRYLFGANVNLTWKGFDITAFVQGVGKRTYRPEQQTIAPLMVSWKQPLAIHRDYWTPENPNALYPRPFTGGNHNYLVADKWLLNGQYMRLKNLQVGYTFPNKLMKKAKISKARIFFTSTDLWTWSKLGNFKGYFDPEQRDNIENDYPFFATASMGLNLNF